MTGVLLAAFWLAAGGAQSASAGAAALSATDAEMLGRIRDEGFRRSQVMATAEHLTDVIGPRLTGSPQMRAANDWTREKLESWGLRNAHLESHDFGEGWSFERCAVRQLSPAVAVLSALPKAWTPGTDGPVRGVAMETKLEKEEDLDELAGKLRGKILFVSDRPEHKDPAENAFGRWDEASLADLEQYDIPAERDSDSWRERSRKRRELWRKIADRLVDEGVVALVDVSSFENGVVRTGGGGNQGIPGYPIGPPQLTMAMEPYERIVRLLDDGIEVELELDVATTFYRDSTLAWNTIAEIPGTGKSGEVVMVGAHLDSWHLGTGATDNGAGSSVALEAVRILQAIGVRPKRTIRIGLWSGEEQGSLGSRAYVAEHFASRPEPTDEAELALPKRYRKTTWPLTTKPEHAKLALYLNLDNGSGRVHGVYAQENFGAKRRFEQWIEPLADLGVTTVTMENTSATDHVSFDGVGIPGFQLIQDGRDYSYRTHHSNLDTYEHLDRESLMQASVVMASLLYQAAMDETPFPRKPLPTEPPEKKARKKSTEDAAAK
ncbi:MAG: M20/M25/M40 family metallo-hydrolase [Thermoanaerobaculia bacterium]